MILCCGRPRRFLLSVAAAFLVSLALMRGTDTPSPHVLQAQQQDRGLRERLSGPCVAAHRGGSWRPITNTLRRFEAARAAGVDIVELDIRLTADGVPVVYHDDAVPRLLGPNPAVSTLSLDALRKAARMHLQPVPTFEEVLLWADGRVVINAEFKEPEVVPAAVTLVQHYQAHEWVYFQCKSDPERYAAARALDSGVALLFKPLDDAQLDWALAQNDSRLVVIELGNEMFRPEVVERVHAADKLVSFNAWRLDPFQEFFGANCAETWDRGTDIAVTKRPSSAVKQRALRKATSATDG